MPDARDYLTVIVLQVFDVRAVVVVGLRLVLNAFDSGRKVAVADVRRDVVDQLMQHLRNERLRVELFVLYKSDAVPKINESPYFLAVDERRRSVYVDWVHDLFGYLLVLRLTKVVVQKNVRKAVVDDLP